MIATEPFPDHPSGKLRTSPFAPADERPLERFIERMVGEGFAMIVVFGERRKGLEEVIDWLELRSEELRAKLHKVNLARFTFDNPWLELDHTIGTIHRGERTILLLHGVDPKSELSKTSEVPLFRQLNVQRDLCTRDFPCFWVLYLGSRFEHQLKMQAPDFCDFVGYWCSILPEEGGAGFSRTTIPATTTTSRTPSPSAFGQDENLLEALGDVRLVEALTSIWDWNLDEARGRIAQYQLAWNKNGRPRACMMFAILPWATAVDRTSPRRSDSSRALR